MTAIAGEDRRLSDTDGFVVESPDGDLGWVEEVWLGDANEPRALAVRTAEGGHGLLLGEEVLAVDRENRWVVVAREPVLLELDTPRLLTAHGRDGGIRFAASWTTTGELLRPSRSRGRSWRLPLPRRRRESPPAAAEPPLWQAVVVLLTSIALMVAFVITLAFLVARLVTGSAY